jgi:uncharacterized protein (TIGR03067 family)
MKITDTEGREKECMMSKLNPNVAPKQLDCYLPADNVVLGIYELQNDQLKLCLRDENGAAKGRPTDFHTTPGSDLLLFILKKQD